MSSTVTDVYVEQCAHDDLLRDLVRQAVLPEVFEQCYRGLLLPRAIFAEDQRVRRFADDLATIFHLLVSLPRRLFDGDLDRYCAAVGIDDRLASLMVRGATGSPPLFGRSDAYFDGNEFKLLEFNIGTELGGMDFAELNRAMLGVPAFRRFADANGLEYIDTAETVAAQLRELARPVATSDRPVVVLLETTGGIAAYAHYRSVQEAMIRCGLDFRLGEVQDVDCNAGRLILDDTPVDVALRFYAAGEILACPGGPDVLEPVHKACEAGGTILFTGLENSLYNTKGGLALLSEHCHREVFAEDERRVIERVVPWTRLLVDDPTVLRQCRDNQAELIIKPSIGWGATGTVLGRDITAEAWRKILAERTGQGHVVQRIVRPAPEPVLDPDTGVVRNWQANWGVFVTESGYAGSFIRALRPEDGTIITFDNRGARAATVFTHGPAKS